MVEEKLEDLPPPHERRPGRAGRYRGIARHRVEARAIDLGSSTWRARHARRRATSVATALSTRPRGSGSRRLRTLLRPAALAVGRGRRTGSLRRARQPSIFCGRAIPSPPSSPSGGRQPGGGSRGPPSGSGGTRAPLHLASRASGTRGDSAVSGHGAPAGGTASEALRRAARADARRCGAEGVGAGREGLGRRSSPGNHFDDQWSRSLGETARKATKEGRDQTAQERTVRWSAIDTPTAAAARRISAPWPSCMGSNYTAAGPRPALLSAAIDLRAAPAPAPAGSAGDEAEAGGGRAHLPSGRAEEVEIAAGVGLEHVIGVETPITAREGAAAERGQAPL